MSEPYTPREAARIGIPESHRGPSKRAAGAPPGAESTAAPTSSLQVCKFTEEQLSQVAAVLTVHWLTEVQCNHEAKTDRSFCWCGSFQSEPQDSVGGAVRRWVEHIVEQIRQHEGCAHAIGTHGEAMAEMVTKAGDMMRADLPTPRCDTASFNAAAVEPDGEGIAICGPLQQVVELTFARQLERELQTMCVLSRREVP